jgi:hypothetical protein
MAAKSHQGRPQSPFAKGGRVGMPRRIEMLQKRYKKGVDTIN